MQHYPRRMLATVSRYRQALMKNFKLVQKNRRGLNFIIPGEDMGELTNVAKTLGGMPTAALIVVVILSAFALAAYAISAVVKVSGKGSDDE